METILIVDDDPTTLFLITSILEPEGYRLLTASDGKEARFLIEKEAGAIRAILLDWQMPEMSGIELLRWIKGHPEFANTPVIMQTGMTHPANIKESIDAGAFYYLTKPFSHKVLESVVRAALNDLDFKELLLKQLKESRSQNPFGMLIEGTFRFRTLKEGERLALWIANATPIPLAAMGITEMFINAIEHGNLCITYDEKTEYMMEGTWNAEIERRLALPRHADKHVEVRITREAALLAVLIKDQGRGFDYEKYLRLDESRVFHNHGRGIALAKSTLDLQYLGNGNTVFVRLPLGATAESPQ